MERCVPGFDVWAQGVGFVFDFLGRRYFELDLFLVAMFWFFFLDFADDELFVLEFLFGRKAVFDYSVFVSFLRSLTTIHPYKNHSFLLLTSRINAQVHPQTHQHKTSAVWQSNMAAYVIAINIKSTIHRGRPPNKVHHQPNRQDRPPTPPNSHLDILKRRPAVNCWHFPNQDHGLKWQMQIADEKRML